MARNQRSWGRSAGLLIMLVAIVIGAIVIGLAFYYSHPQDQSVITQQSNDQLKGLLGVDDVSFPKMSTTSLVDAVKLPRSGQALILNNATQVRAYTVQYPNKQNGFWISYFLPNVDIAGVASAAQSVDKNTWVPLKIIHTDLAGIIDFLDSLADTKMKVKAQMVLLRQGTGVRVVVQGFSS